MPENDHIKQLLLQVSQNGDMQAYKDLFLLLHMRLRQFAYSMLKSREEAEELVSDLFIRIWEKRDRLTEIEAPLFYFYTTAKNMAYNRISGRTKQPLQPEDWLIQLESVCFNPEQLLMTKEMLMKIQRSMEELPPRCRLIFKLVKEDGLKYREVAALLQLSVKTVEAQMAIAIRRMAKNMQMDLGKMPVSEAAKKK